MQFRGSSDAKHVSSWFQPWATLWPTCHMLVPASLLQSVECSTECKNSIFHCTIGCNKYKSSLASGASVPPPWTPASCLGPCCASTWHGLPQKSLVPEALFKSSSGSRGGCGTGFRTLKLGDLLPLPERVVHESSAKLSTARFTFPRSRFSNNRACSPLHPHSSMPADGVVEASKIHLGYALLGTRGD